jgi:multicomponent Na+:H+ antiporter subunit B
MRAGQRILPLCAAAAVGAAALWAAWGLGVPAGPAARYGEWANAAAPSERRSPEAVTAIVFDIRGFDTFGEECILFTAVFAVAALLRKQPEDTASPPEGTEDAKPTAPEPILIPFARAAFPLLAAFGVYVILHGHLSPGGGFQGGVAVATAFLAAALAGRFQGLREAAGPVPSRMSEAAGLIGYAATGMAGVFAGKAFLQNVLPLGASGNLASAGTLPVLGGCAGLAVAGAFASLFRELLGQARRQSPREDA